MARKRKKAELTLTFAKPDSMRSSLTGAISSAFSKSELKHAATREAWPSREHVDEHYKFMFEAYKKKYGVEPPFREIVTRYIMGLRHYPDDPASRRIEICVFYGEDAIKKIRAVAGPTFPPEAKDKAPTTIRGQHAYMEPIRREDNMPIVSEGGTILYDIWNCVHTSDEEGAEREVKLWMPPGPINTGEWRVYDWRTSDEYFRFNPATGRVIKSNRAGVRTFIAPGDPVWESDFQNLLRYRDGKSKPTQSLNSIILKYDVIPHEQLTWE